MDVLDHADLPFPQSLPEFQRLFPDDAACAAYLEKARWNGGFICPHCQIGGEPFRFDNRPGVLRCRKCRKNTGLTVGTVMERSHTPLSVWFWAAYLVTSQTPGMSAVQFQRQLGLSRYETAFGILHKLRAGMVRPGRDRIGGQPENMSRWTKPRWADERAAKAGASTIRRWWLAPSKFAIGSRAPHRTSGRMAATPGVSGWPSPPTGAPNRCADSSRAPSMPGSLIVTDDWSGYGSLRKRGYDHHAIAECGDPEVAEEFLPIIHLVFSNLKAWLNGIHHGVSAKHLQAYLNEFTFRFNRRFYPFNAFRSLLGIAGDATAPTYAELYSGEWQHPKCSGCGS